MLPSISIRLAPMMKHARLFSTQGEDAVRKLKEVMQEYRLEHYSQETPRRFKREIVAAAKNSEDHIVIESMERVLNNIGASQKLSREELNTVFTELGENGVISGDRMTQLI
mmetsp:Transcript_39670/g.45191  ORF Transcript_39670/g.45191 Transcript_39670/m.45191 type:complete len:111 (+) Transcript_39670:68-400(+)|eukprot:CAMPEP_0194129700 /NCGR_PEP_ID=MMETSP0152-20130528/918_1 /TAXON_ID=1049557 /ORGANISM="Thalassiothrix antarctica, Strain L6-D1" /LENGTH=110 /DNA_ID=CAMNT_0038824015 /DNA_START=72 /DNA_END=404 /DNA_ORIENTATION=-